MFSDVGVNAEHLSGNFLSCIREQDDFSQFSYSSLVQKFPQLKACRRFLPSRELLSLIFSALSTGSPNIPTARVKLGRLSAK